MQLLNLIRAHVFRHSTAALALGRYDLARVISLKKLEALTLQQAKLLSRRKKLQDKINQGSIFKWFYQKELNNIEIKSAKLEAKMELNITKYRERAISAQACIEAKLDVTMKPSSIQTKVLSIASLTPYMLGSYVYSNANQCLNKANILLKRGQMRYVNEQTLRMTANMFSSMVRRIHDLGQVRYLANQAKVLLGPHSSDQEIADQMISTTKEDFRSCMSTIQEIGANIILLTVELQRSFDPEIAVIQSMIVSMRSFDSLYGKVGATDGMQVRDSRDPLTHMNVLLPQEKEELSKTISYLESIIGILS